MNTKICEKCESLLEGMLDENSLSIAYSCALDFLFSSTKYAQLELWYEVIYSVLFILLVSLYLIACPHARKLEIKSTSCSFKSLTLVLALALYFNYLIVFSDSLPKLSIIISRSAFHDLPTRGCRSSRLGVMMKSFKVAIWHYYICYPSKRKRRYRFEVEFLRI